MASTRVSEERLDVAEEDEWYDIGMLGMSLSSGDDPTNLFYFFADFIKYINYYILISIQWQYMPLNLRIDCSYSLN